MADKHPYISGAGAVIQLFDQLKKSFPAAVNADVLKKLSIAPSNESYAISVIRYLGLIDDAGNRNAEAHKVFTLHDEASFRAAFSQLVEQAYGDLFALHGAGAWELSTEQLIAFFRQADQSSAVVGARQATTFKALAGYAGHGDPDTGANNRQPRGSVKRVAREGRKANDERKPKADGQQLGSPVKSDGNVGLTVRIEVNLPAAGDQETYDRIFRSIKENLLNG